MCNNLHPTNNDLQLKIITITSELPTVHIQTDKPFQYWINKEYQQVQSHAALVLKGYLKYRVSSHVWTVTHKTSKLISIQSYLHYHSSDI